MDTIAEETNKKHIQVECSLTNIEWDYDDQGFDVASGHLNVKIRVGKIGYTFNYKLRNFFKWSSL